VSEAAIENESEMLGFFSQLCGESHGDNWLDGALPDWLNPERWTSMYEQHTEGIYKILNGFISGQMGERDDPECVARWAACVCRLFPALRLANYRLSQENNPTLKALAAKIKGLEKYAFGKLIEKIQGVALAALYYGNPKFGMDRFMGDVKDNNTVFANLLDKRYLRNGGVWCPAYTQMGKELPGPQGRDGRPRVSPNMDCMQEDMKALENPKKAYEVHLSILRTLKHLLAPCPDRSRELLEQLELEPGKTEEIHHVLGSFMCPIESLQVVSQKSAIVPYLIEVLEMQDNSTKPIHKLKVMACEVIEDLINAFEIKAGVGAKVILDLGKSRLLPILERLLCQQTYADLRWQAVRVVTAAAKTKDQTDGRRLITHGFVKALCTTLQYFKDYSDSMLMLYKKVTPFYNSVYAIHVIEGLHAFAAHAGDEAKFADHFALHCLVDIKRLVQTMLEPEFVANKFIKNIELGRKVHLFLLLLKTQLGQPPPTATYIVKQMMAEKHKRVMDVDVLCEKFTGERGGGMNDAEMSVAKAPEKAIVKYKITMWRPDGVSKTTQPYEEERSNCTFENLIQGTKHKLNLEAGYFSYVHTKMNELAEIRSDADLKTALEQYDEDTKQYLEVSGYMDREGSTSTGNGAGGAGGATDGTDLRVDAQTHYSADSVDPMLMRQGMGMGMGGVMPVAMGGKGVVAMGGGKGASAAGLMGAGGMGGGQNFNNFQKRHLVVQELGSVTQITQENLTKLYDEFMQKSKGKPEISVLDVAKVLTKMPGIMLPPKHAERTSSAFDKNNDGYINVREFCLGMSALAPSATDIQKLDFLFKMYDNDGNGSLDRAEVTVLIGDMLESRHRGVGVEKMDKEDMVRILFDHVDTDKSDSIELEEFRELATNHKLANVRKEILRILSPLSSQY